MASTSDESFEKDLDRFNAAHMTSAISDSETNSKMRHEEESDTEENADQDMQADPLYGDFTEDGDVVERIRSRASFSSDYGLIKQLREKYKEGFFELSADDRRRPLNWSQRKRIAHTLAFGFCTLTAILGATVFVPASFNVAARLHKGSAVGVLAFSVYLLGNFVGPILITPMADVYGRKICVLVPLFISGVFQCVCANADSMAAIVVYRFLAGVFAAGAVSCSSGAVVDMWPTKVRGIALVYFSIFFIVGTTTSPILGALLLTTGSYGWRWCAWLGGLLALFVSTMCMLVLDETLLPVVEKTVAKNIRLETGFWGLHSAQDKCDDHSLAQTALVYIQRPLVMMLIPSVFLTVLCASYSTGVLFLLLTIVGRQFRDIHNFSHPASECSLVAILVGYFLGCIPNAAASKRYAALMREKKHNPLPEVRLPPMMFLGWLISAGLFVYGWTMRSNIHWIVPMVGLMLFGIGLATVLQGCANYLTDAFTNSAASALAANTMFRYICAGVFPLFARQMFTTLHVDWGASLLGFVSIGIIPISWILFLLGTRFHQHDPYGQAFEI
nr:ST.10 [Starmerella bombicola]